MTRTNDFQPTDPADGADDITESSATPDAKNTSADTTDTQQTDTTESSTEAPDAQSHLPNDAQQTLPFDSNATVPLNGTPIAANDANATLPFAAASASYATPSAPVDPTVPKPRAWYRKPVAIGGMAAAVIILGGTGIGLGIAGTSGSNAELASNNSRTLNGPNQGESDSAGGPRLSTGMAGLGAHGPGLSGTVLAVSGDTITITDSDGFVRTINVTADTEYGDGLAADLEEGLEIRATGTINDDDTSLDATSITTATAGHGSIGGPGIGGPGIGGGHGGPRGADAGTTGTPIDPPNTPAM